MARYIFVILFSLWGLAIQASPVILAGIKGISNELLENADAVIRDYTMNVTVDKSGRNVTVTEHYIVTVVNEQGRDEADYENTFGSYETLLKIDGVVFDAAGKTVQKIKKSDFSVTNSSLESGSYDDVKSWKYRVVGVDYPYTVEFNVAYKINHTFYLPSFIPHWSHNLSIQKSAFTISVPRGFNIRHKSFGYQEGKWPMLLAMQNGDSIYTWRYDSVQAIKKEPLSHNRAYVNGTVLLAPVKFMLDDYTADMQSWEDISSFVYQLNDKKDELPENINTVVKQLIAGKNTIREKVSVLYNYLQENTRYVAIEYGINGWQALDAAYTCRNKFGDCKALSYYMKGLLRAAGIQSYAVLIHAGDDNMSFVLEDFPLPAFNHVILMVPQNPDTIWLECTSKDLPAGYLSDFTQNRKALVVAPQNGSLVHTPVYDTSYNIIRRYAKVTVTEKGGYITDIHNQYLGEPAISLLWKTDRKSRLEIEKLTSEKFRLGSYSVKDVQFSRKENAATIEMVEKGELHINDMVKDTKAYKLFNYSVLPSEVPEVVQVGKRVTQFRISNSLNVIDSFVIELPPLGKVTPLPDEQMYTQFGMYERVVREKDGLLVITRQFTLNQGVYAPADFSAYEAWLDKVKKDSYKAVIVSKP